MPSTERNFTVQGSDIGFTGGHYTASSPAAAGKKAGRQLFKMIENGKKYHDDKKKYAKYSKFAAFAKHSGDKTIKFLLRETTQGTAKKSFYYEVSQTKLKTPVIVSRGGVEITISKEFKIKSCKEPHPTPRA